MISKKMQDAINAQINAEMWSAYLYLAMSMDAKENGMDGVAHWFRKQYNEEMEHAFKFVGYLQKQCAHVELKPVAEVPVKWGCPVKMYEETLALQTSTTSTLSP